MTWYFYALPKDQYGQQIFRAGVNSEQGYIAITEADDFNQATLQFSQWLSENGYGVSAGYSVINAIWV